MKIVQYILLVLCFISSVSLAQTHLDIKVPDSIEHDLVGHVKMVKETAEKELLFGDHKKSTEQDERTYDSKGNRLVKRELDTDGNVICRIEYQYDEKGCFVKESVVDAGKNKHEEFEISVDLHKRIILKENTKTHEKKVTLYTLHGFEDVIKELDSQGRVISIADFTRLPNNKESKYVKADEKGKPITTVKVDWNRDGTKQQVVFENHLKDSKCITKYNYIKKDQKGNWTERVEYTTLIKKGKAIPLSKVIATRIIKYYNEMPGSRLNIQTLTTNPPPRGAAGSSGSGKPNPNP